MKKGISTLFLVLVVPALALSATLTVPVPYSSIQAAINAANDYDEVWVDPGTYVENIDFIGKAIIVKSTGGNAVTVIDGSMPTNPNFRSVAVFKTYEQSDSVLDGFTLTNGTGSLDAATTFDFCGGGIYCKLSSPTIINNIIEYNTLSTTSNAGGGIFLESSLATIQNNIIRNNSAIGGWWNKAGYGGGICCYYSSPDISQNVFSDNSVTINGSGGGVACLSSYPDINNNTFTSNLVTDDQHYGGVGAGVFCSACDPSITYNTFENNTAYSGGGVGCASGSSPEILNNTFNNNDADYGGGVSCSSTSDLPSIQQNTFDGNTASTGGAINGGGATITDNVIQYNQATHGGGISNGKIIKNNTLYKNTATSNGGGIHLNNVTTTEDNLIESNNALNGAGIYCSSGNSTNRIIRSNLIIKNVASANGGGIHNYKGSPLLERNMIKNNSAILNGGGIYLNLHQTADYPVVNNIILDNTAAYGGGGIYIDNSDPDLLHNTIYNNKANISGGGGLSVNNSKQPRMVNSILWDNTAPSTKGIEIFVGGSSELVINHCNVKGGMASTFVEPGSLMFWGPGMLDSNPRFVVETTGDLHIFYDSPCREAGDSSAAGLPLYDYDGDPRQAYVSVDMGADEFSTHLYYSGNATPMGTIAINFVDTPNTSPVIMWLGSGIMDPPMYHKKYGYWYLEFPLLMELDMGSIPYPGGVLELPAFIPNGTPTPLDLPIQALIGNKLSNLTVIEIR